jgi:hypothetical protein
MLPLPALRLSQRNNSVSVAARQRRQRSAVQTRSAKSLFSGHLTRGKSIVCIAFIILVILGQFNQ